MWHTSLLGYHLSRPSLPVLLPRKWYGEAKGLLHGIIRVRSINRLWTSGHRQPLLRLWQFCCFEFHLINENWFDLIYTSDMCQAEIHVHGCSLRQKLSHHVLLGSIPSRALLSLRKPLAPSTVKRVMHSIGLPWLIVYRKFQFAQQLFLTGMQLVQIEKKLSRIGSPSFLILW